MNPAKLISLIFGLIAINFVVNAQVREISGTVRDNNTGWVLPSVNILIKGTNNGAISTSDGTYHLFANPNDVLVFSSVGFLNQEIVVGDQDIIDINLSMDIRSLEEVIVTGYSIDSKRKVTGAVATVDSKDLSFAPTGNVEQMLQGRVAGVTVITNGQPGTTSQVRVRGYGALRGPLYVVDGVPTATVDFLAPGDIQSTTVLKDAAAASIYGSRASGGVIVITTRQGQKKEGMLVTYDGMFGVAYPGSGPDLMNPQQQAEWTWNAIRNSAQQSRTDPIFMHSQYGSGSEPILPDWLLVGTQAGVVGSIDLETEREKYNIDARDGPIYQVVPANKTGTNWYDAMTRNAMIHRHHIGLSGDDKNNRYYVGLGAQVQEGNPLHQKFERYSFRFNSEFVLVPGLRIGENVQITHKSLNNIRGFFSDGMTGGIGSADDENEILSAFTNAPIIPIYDQFGGYGGSAAPEVAGIDFAGGTNPVAQFTRSKNDQNFTTGVFGNIYLEYSPIENLVARTSFGGEYQSWNVIQYRPRAYEQAVNFPYRFAQLSLWRTQWVWTNTLNYKFDLGEDHSFGILLGQEALNTGTFRDIFGSGNNPFAETVDFVNLNTVENRFVSGNHSNGANFSSYFGKVNYDFNDKFQATLVVRRDGSSRFGSEKRWGTFPAVSVGWRISEESFLHGIKFIDDLRIRAGYGDLGNSNNIPDNNQFSLFSNSISRSSFDIDGTNNSASSGVDRFQIGNPEGHWETSRTANIGLDMLLWNGKFDASIDVWRTNTKDLLFPFPVAAEAGFFLAENWPWQNLGEMKNQGIDIGIATRGNIANDLSYGVALIGSFLDNEMVSLGPNTEDLEIFSGSYRGIIPMLNQVGQPLGSFYGYKVQGLFSDHSEVDEAAIQQDAAPGRFRYLDIDENDSITVDDRTVLGSPIADFTGGIALSLMYKNFELKLYGYASIGNEIFNMTRWYTDFYKPIGSAISTRVLDSWSFDNPSGNTPLFENAANFSTSGQSNSYYVEDGSYFRMQNITLAYNFPASLIERWGLSHLRVTTSGNNLFTITNYSGLDPSVAAQWDHQFGVDVGNFPINTNWTIGVNVGF